VEEYQNDKGYCRFQITLSREGKPVVSVEVDERVEAVLEALPGANCGGCGHLGCSEYAVAIATENAPVNKCPVGGENCAIKIASIMGVEVGESVIKRPIVRCGATLDERLGKTDYRGEKRCAAANLVAGVQGCTFGCLGFGDCAVVCKYNAMHIVKGLATVDYNKCVGCGACAKVCPRSIITIAEFNEEEIPSVLCSNKDRGKDVTKVCNKGCIGCKACVKITELFFMEKDLARTDYKAYKAQTHKDSAIEAAKKCPNNSISFVGKIVGFK